MRAVQLELEKIIKYFDEQARLNYSRAWEEGTDFAAEEAYLDAKKKCEKLMEVIVGNYPEGDWGGGAG